MLLVKASQNCHSKQNIAKSSVLIEIIALIVEKSTNSTGISGKQFQKVFLSKERNTVKSRIEEISK